jgi:hypothetical protein
MSNLVIIDDYIDDINIFKDSINTNCDIYLDSEIQKENNYNIIKNNTYERVGLVWKDTSILNIPILKYIEYNDEEYEEDIDILLNDDQYFSYYLIELIKSLLQNNPNLILDLISCNIYEPKLIDYIDDFSEKYNIEINYSIDKTGNPDHGGNWIMENSGINIKDVYFNNNIINYHHLLDTIVITVTGNNFRTLIITQSYVDSLTESVTFTGSRVKFVEDINWDYEMCFNIENENNYQVIIDGGKDNGFTVNIVGNNTNGLIRLSNDSNILIENLRLHSEFTARSENSFLVSDMNSTTGCNIEIKNCHISGDLRSKYTGGYGGRRFGRNSTTLISDCRFGSDIETHIMSNRYTSGFTGHFSGQNGILKIINCHSNADMNDRESGGICGPLSGSGGTLFIYNCYNTGRIANGSGGIISERCCTSNNDIVYIINCYNTGEIAGGEAGGIIGRNSFTNNTNVYIINCYNTGNINSGRAGGIVGKGTFDTSINFGLIANCYNAGEIVGERSGGICAADINVSNLIIYNCYSSGNITGRFSGPIIGNDNNGNNNSYIINCYSTNDINSENTGGITGDNSDNFIILGCYSLGDINRGNSGTIFGRNSSNNTVYGFYSLDTIDKSSNGFAVNGSNTVIDYYYIDGDITIPQLNSDQFYKYGFESDANNDYPILKSFTQAPWIGYTSNDSLPTLDFSLVNNIDTLFFNDLVGDIRSELSSYDLVIPIPRILNTENLTKEIK